MIGDRKSSRTLALVAASSALCLAYLLLVRPWYLQWGATPSEQRKALPGDSIIPNAVRQGTRAITINVGIQKVWPWLAQLGQDRGGFYSFDLLENIVGCEVPTTDALRPDKQSWTLGDSLWMYPKAKAGGIGFATLRVFEPGRVLAFGTRATGTSLNEPEDGSWAIDRPLTGSRA